MRRLLGDAAVAAPAAHYLADATAQWRGIRGHADAVVLPQSTGQVQSVLAWCTEHECQVTPRGGGTASRAARYRSRAASCSHSSVCALCARSSLSAGGSRSRPACGRPSCNASRARAACCFAVDPGAAEQSQIGGNIATNAGGPHSFKYGTTRAQLSGLEAVLASGERIELGGKMRKDVAGYDLLGLLAGSEGTLAVITAAHVKLVPAREAQLPLVALYPDALAGTAAIERILGLGSRGRGARLSRRGRARLDGRRASRSRSRASAGFMLITEADGSAAEAARLHAEVTRGPRR